MLLPATETHYHFIYLIPFPLKSKIDSTFHYRNAYWDWSEQNLLLFISCSSWASLQKRKAWEYKGYQKLLLHCHKHHNLSTFLFQYSPPRPSSRIWVQVKPFQGTLSVISLLSYSPWWKKHAVPWWRFLQMETSVMPSAFPLGFQPGTHTHTLSALGSVTDHRSPTCQAAFILSIWQTAQLSISSNVFYISTYLFRWKVWIHYLSPFFWCPSTYSPRQGK